jgi:hypothetical protein
MAPADGESVRVVFAAVAVRLRAPAARLPVPVWLAPDSPDAAPGALPAPPPGAPAAPPACCEVENVGVVELSSEILAALMPTIAPAPMMRPTRPPSTAWMSVSAVMLPSTRTFDQPIALSVPSSRVRREMLATVNRLASRKASARMPMVSQRPNPVIQPAAEARLPEMLPARSAWVDTVAPLTVFLSAAATVLT